MALTKVITGVTDLNQAQSTNGLKFPTGSVFAGTPEKGMIRNDQSQSSETSSSAMQFYNGTAWKNFVNKSNIPLGSDNFNTVLYQGNGSTQAVTGTAFTPDLVWVKGRGVATSNNFFDSIRGNQRIISNSTSAQVDLNPYAPDGLPSFNSNGFNIGDNFNGDYGLNGDPSGTYGSAAGYVAWCWKAGGTAVSNTDGTITSQVSANTAAGFSIVSYTGNSSSSATVGHGLDSIPELTIFKQLSSGGTSGGYWNVYYTPSNIVGFLNETNALASNNGGTNGSVDISNMDSTKFGFLVGSSSVNNQNNNLSEYIVYAFHSVAGYSKIGSYTGNGSSTGPTIVTGFEPAWVMVKRTDNTSAWNIQDNKRNTTNPRTSVLQASSSDQEYTSSTYAINFNTNDFQIVNSDNGWNTSGGTYIYMAFAAT